MNCSSNEVGHGADDSILEAALAYLKRGWSIIPLVARDKKPLVKWTRFQSERATENDVREWFRRTPDANIGIVTGEISGIVAIDEDGPDGQAAFTANVGEIRTLTSESGRIGGRHLIFAHPGFATATTAKILDHVDVRGDGGYIVAPPSVHPNGKRYRWSSDGGCGYDTVPAPLPEGLHVRIRKSEPKPNRERKALSPRVTREELDQTVMEGERDNQLVRYAGSFVAEGLHGDDLVDRLREINETRFLPPLTEREVQRIAESAERMEARKTRKPRTPARAILEDLHDVVVEEVRWTWKGYIPSGAITMVDGIPGVGKSTLSLDLAARVSTGREMPDGSAGVRGHVLLLNNEDMTAVTVKPRVVAAGGDDRQITVLKEVGVGDAKRLLRLPDDMEAIREAVIAKGTKLIVIDPIMGFLAGDVNSYSDQHVRGALAPLAMLAHEKDLAVLLVRHPTKNRERSALEAGGGSIGIIAAARSGFYVAENPNVKGEIVIASTKSNYAVAPRSMAFRIESSADGRPRISWQGYSELSAQDLRPQIAPKANPIDNATEFLQDFLKDGARSLSDINAAAGASGISHSTLKRAKNRIGVATRKTAFDGGWSWSLPTAEADQPDSNAASVVSFSSNGDPYHGGEGGGKDKTKETNSPLRASSTDGTDGGDDRRAA